MVRNLHLQYSYPQGQDYYLLTVEGTPPYDRACWKKTWEDIFQMKSLRNVRVDIFLRPSFIHATFEDIFFSPLKELRDPVQVEVRVNWKINESGAKEKTWPFILKRHRAFHQEIDESITIHAEESED
jgi:hypothetical protein